jgi:hypothetical protein
MGLPHRKMSRNCERQRFANDSKTPFLDYKSAALPTELCRLLPGKILSDAASASVFLYAFSIRPRLTPLEASFWTRPEHTGGNSHRFGASATTHRLPLGAATAFVGTMLNGWERVYERVRRKGLADNCRAESRQVCILGIQVIVAPWPARVCRRPSPRVSMFPK